MSEGVDRLLQHLAGALTAVDGIAVSGIEFKKLRRIVFKIWQPWISMKAAQLFGQRLLFAVMVVVLTEPAISSQPGRMPVDKSTLLASSDIKRPMGAVSLVDRKSERSYNFGSMTCVNGGEGCEGNALAATCGRTALREAIQWIGGSATWADGLHEMLVISPAASEILGIGRDGRIGRPNLKLPAGSASPAPLALERFGAGYLFVATDYRAFALSPGLAVFDEGSLLIDERGSATGLGDLVDWVADENEIIGYGSLKAGESFALGFVRAQISRKPLSLKSVEMLLPFESQPYYLLGHRYVASNQLGVFMLGMKDGVKLWWYSRAHALKELSSFPSEYSRLPRFPDLKRPADAQALFAWIEKSTIPVGLFGRGKLLYILTRKPRNEIQTEWQLHEIDPLTDRPVATFNLPTNAHHITIAVSADNWYVFEKDSVSSVGSGPIKSILTIPSEWLTEPRKSPIVIGGAGVSCDMLKKMRTLVVDEAGRSSIIAGSRGLIRILGQGNEASRPAV